jgi:hypothetical protein
MEFASLKKFEDYYYTYAQSEGYNVWIKRCLELIEHMFFDIIIMYVLVLDFTMRKKSIEEVDSDQEKMGRRTLTRRSGCPVAIIVLKKKGV